MLVWDTIPGMSCSFLPMSWLGGTESRSRRIIMKGKTYKLSLGQSAFIPRSSVAVDGQHVLQSRSEAESCLGRTSDI